MNDEMREAYNKWTKKEARRIKKLINSPVGLEVLPPINIFREGFQAAWQHQQKKIEGLAAQMEILTGINNRLVALTKEKP